jgi:hypothetical protein
MSNDPNRRNKKSIFFRELRICLFIVFMGFLFMSTNTDSTAWRYPLSPSPDLAENIRIFGRIVLFGGYPLTIILRLFIKMIKKILMRNN